ncbi:MAG TPA: 6-phosphogluconolactonase [Acidisarcina sp.]
MSTQISYYVFSTPDELIKAAADRLLAKVIAAAEARGVARIAISGGNTPRPMFQLLGSEPYLSRMPWDKLQLFWVDERCVPPDHPDSNYRMTREAMLDRVPLPAAQIFRMEGELDPQQAAANYENLLRQQFNLHPGQFPTFDAIQLGMGDDGHTASLFPHTDALHEQTRLVVANHVPQKDTWRITLTLPVILAGRDVSFLIQGSDKSEVLKDVLLGAYDPETHPSQLIRPLNGNLIFLLDEGAGAELPTVGADGWGRLEIGA